MPQRNLKHLAISALHLSTEQKRKSVTNKNPTSNVHFLKLLLEVLAQKAQVNYER